MSKTQRFIVWTDASTVETHNNTKTSIGYVIKDSDMPPLCGSAIYDNIKNSKGELTAGIECLDTLAGYCRCFNIDTEKCIVELKTDFPELKNAINNNIKIGNKNEEKKKLLEELEKLKGEFKIVICEEIKRWTNIAHNVCYFRAKEAVGNGKKNNNLVEDFLKYYKQPELCVKKD